MLRAFFFFSNAFLQSNQKLCKIKNKVAYRSNKPTSKCSGVEQHVQQYSSPGELPNN